jgi:hypothetical protein
MVINLNFLVSSFFVTAVVGIVLFLPAFVELKRPHDNGPRLIFDFQTNYLRLPTMEKEQWSGNFQFDKLLPVLTALYNLEA